MKVTVEPVLFCYTAGWSIFQVAFTTGLYWKICEQQFGNNQTLQANCSTLEYAPEIEAFTQKESALWTFYTNLATLIPTISAGLFCSALGDKFGHRWTIVLAQLAMISYASIYYFEFQFLQLPLLLIPVISAVLAFSGLSTTIFAACYAYVADFVEEKNLLTIRFALIDATNRTAEVVFGFATAFIMRDASFANAVLIAICFWAIGVLYVIIMLKRVKQQPADALCSGDDRTVDTNASGEGPSAVAGSTGVTSQLLEKPFRILTNRRSQVRRTCLLITLIFVYFSAVCDGATVAVFGLFAMHSPISWQGYDIAMFNGIHATIKAAGTIVETFALKRLLKLHETSIILIGACSRICYALMLGLAENGVMIIIAGSVDVFSAVLGPATTAFASQLVDRDEVGTILAMSTLAMNLGYATAFGCGSYLYRATLDIHRGFVFMFGAGLFSIALGLMLWVHLDLRRQRNRLPQEEAANSEHEDT